MHIRDLGAGLEKDTVYLVPLFWLTIYVWISISREMSIFFTMRERLAYLQAEISSHRSRLEKMEEERDRIFFGLASIFAEDDGSFETAAERFDDATPAQVSDEDGDEETPPLQIGTRVVITINDKYLGRKGTLVKPRGQTQWYISLDKTKQEKSRHLIYKAGSSFAVIH